MAEGAVDGSMDTIKALISLYDPLLMRLMMICRALSGVLPLIPICSISKLFAQNVLTVKRKNTELEKGFCGPFLSVRSVSHARHMVGHRSSQADSTV